MRTGTQPASGPAKRSRGGDGILSTTALLPFRWRALLRFSSGFVSGLVIPDDPRDVLNPSRPGVPLKPRAAQRVQRPRRLLDRHFRIFPPQADPFARRRTT